MVNELYVTNGFATFNLILKEKVKNNFLFQQDLSYIQLDRLTQR